MRLVHKDIITRLSNWRPSSVASSVKWATEAACSSIIILVAAIQARFARPVDERSKFTRRACATSILGNHTTHRAGVHLINICFIPHWKDILRRVGNTNCTSQVACHLLGPANIWSTSSNLLLLAPGCKLTSCYSPSRGQESFCKPVSSNSILSLRNVEILSPESFTNTSRRPCCCRKLYCSTLCDTSMAT